MKLSQLAVNNEVVMVGYDKDGRPEAVLAALKGSGGYVEKYVTWLLDCVDHDACCAGHYFDFPPAGTLADANLAKSTTLAEAVADFNDRMKGALARFHR